MVQQLPLSSDDQAPETDRGDGTASLLDDLAYLRLSMVNVVFVGQPGAGDRQWVLIDAGLLTSRDAIQGAARKRFGAQSRPAAILLTHGHFDHVGALLDLAEAWDAPVLAHVLEHPYLNGTLSYPPADPWVGGLVALMSPLFPRSPIDAGKRLEALPSDGGLPAMPDWRWMHTPGHAPGHVSFWREADRTLITGDAIITTAQESAYEVATRALEMHGPPRYFTPDWIAAGRSAASLAALEPEMIVSGHGLAVAGSNMRWALRELAARFEEIAVPDNRQ